MERHLRVILASVIVVVFGLGVLLMGRRAHRSGGHPGLPVSISPLFHSVPTSIQVRRAVTAAATVAPAAFAGPLVQVVGLSAFTAIPSALTVPQGIPSREGPAYQPPPAPSSSPTAAAATPGETPDSPGRLAMADAPVAKPTDLEKTWDRDWYATPTPTPEASFCPLGTREEIKKEGTSQERVCTKGDRGGIAYLEGPFVALYSNGKKKSEGRYSGGRPDGHWVDYFANGHRQAEGDFTSGKKTGRWTTWWENGKKSTEGEYVRGYKQGHWAFYDEAGHEEREGVLRTIDNVTREEGRWIYFWADGSKKSEGSFQAGRRDGRWLEYDSRGRVVSADDYREGFKETL